MLRLAYPGWRTPEDLLSEALWLRALAQDTDIPVPGILPTRAGDLVLSISHPDIPDIWHMTLMGWVPGRLLGHYLTEQNLKKMGRLFAALHHHGAEWQPPVEFSTRRFEHWLSRGEADLLTDPGGSQNQAAQSERKIDISKSHRAWISRMISQVEAAYQTIDRSDLRVIHCDLWHDNIKLHQGKLYPFDFEDTVWGYRVHDIAMAMLDLLETVGEARYPTLLDAFQEGYTAHLPWPIDPIEPFQIGRLLWKINWVARFQPQYLKDMVENHIPVFAHFERTGEVLLPKSG
jgi:Ser/Thr protein kinase RdoA (MazF antagonist)